MASHRLIYLTDYMVLRTTRLAVAARVGLTLGHEVSLMQISRSQRSAYCSRKTGDDQHRAWASCGAGGSDAVTGLGRRAFLRGVAGLTVAPAGPALFSTACGLAQFRPSARVPRIGYMALGPREEGADQVDAFVQGLRDLGYVEGQTIGIEWRFTQGGPDPQFAEAAAQELVGLPVDLIVTGTTPLAQAAQRATSTIPIVATNVANPVETGLVACLGRPGGNITALTVNVPGMRAKYVGLLREVVPGLSRVAALIQPSSACSRIHGQDSQRAV